MTPAELAADPWAFGPWCFVIDDVRVLDTPIPVRGMQGIWPLVEEHRTVLSALCPMDTYVTSALTLLQPYASAIAYGTKRIENRPWRRTLPPHGLWVGLHAGVSWYSPPPAWFAGDAAKVPRGVLLGVMHFAECLRYPAADDVQAKLFRGGSHG